MFFYIYYVLVDLCALYVFTFSTSNREDCEPLLSPITTTKSISAIQTITKSMSLGENALIIKIYHTCHLTFWKMGYSALNLEQANCCASSLVPGSCFKNWLQGKAKTSKPEFQLKYILHCRMYRITNIVKGVQT